MPITPTSKIVIAGAGSVGCYVGGRLVLAGRKVAFLLRPELKQALQQHGMRLDDFEGKPASVPPERLDLGDDPATAFAGAALILVTVKSGATQAMGELIASHAPPDAAIVSLQNGVDNVALLKRILGPARTVIAGMVPFNIVQQRPSGAAPGFRRATGGKITIESGHPEIRDLLSVEGATVAEHDNMEGLQWSKLLLNLNNALNALAGVPLKQEFADRGWRRLFSDQIREGLAVLNAAGIRPVRFEGIPPRLIARVLRMPNLLFRILARGMLAIDPAARSSMWDDLEKGRPTEIDHIQGKIIALGRRYGVPTPVNASVAQLIAAAEKAGKGSPRLSPRNIVAAA